MMEPKELKPISQFGMEYPAHSNMLLQYPETTHYKVDGRGSIVLVSNGRTLAYITNILEGDVEL